MKGNFFYYRLHEAQLLDGAPSLTARFRTALLSHEDGHDFWDLDQVHTMSSQLIDHDPAEPALHPLVSNSEGSDRRAPSSFRVVCDSFWVIAPRIIPKLGDGD